jgi:mono/diheme cytochrome c family protein
MKVYTGEKDNQDNINWKNPTPLPGDSTTIKIDEGQKLFKASCTSCHKIYENFVGPALYGVTERRTKKWLYDFTRHSLQMVSEQPLDIRDSINFYDPYSLCLKKKYGNVVMTPFPQLSDDVLDRLYSYIKTESDKRPDLKYQFKNTCCDSCEEYNKRIKILLKKKEELINENGDFFNLERIIPIPQINVPDNNSNVNNVPVIITPYSKVNPLSASAVYYTINISAVGWYNIDILMKEYSACQQSELFVRIQGGYKIDLNVVLIIPSVKAFVEGGKLKNNEQYGFDEDNGKIPLPQNVQSYILAFGEYENKIIFGKTIFNTQLQQTIDVAVAEITKGKMIAEVKAFNLDDVNMNIKKSKNSEITETNEELKESERLKPENCNCDSEPTTVPLPLNSK